jgi:hypothetical protein
VALQGSLRVYPKGGRSGFWLYGSGGVGWYDPQYEYGDWTADGWRLIDRVRNRKGPGFHVGGGIGLSSSPKDEFALVLDACWLYAQADHGTPGHVRSDGVMLTLGLKLHLGNGSP